MLGYTVLANGLRLLAASAGVPSGRYGRHAGVSARSSAAEADEASANHRRWHELGVNRVFVRLATDARCVGGRLAVWMNEAESTCRFVHEGGSYWIRPDSSGVMQCRGWRQPFLLEYDRGTLSRADLHTKLEAYRRYYCSRAWVGKFDVPPLLLFVCADDRAEEHVVAALLAGALGLPVLLTTEWRYGRDKRNQSGLFGRIWRARRPQHDRVAFTTATDGLCVEESDGFA